jgi:predicted SnoaL-like aldol condensation-catalyzing enzyme
MVAEHRIEGGKLAEHWDMLQAFASSRTLPDDMRGCQTR